MYALIRNGRYTTDGWRTLTLADNDNPHSVRLPVGPVLVPLSVWHARRTELVHREYEHDWPPGIWLAAGESAESIEHDIHDFAVIAVQADKSAGSNGLAKIRLLLERYGYTGELRAIVDLPREKLAFQKQFGVGPIAWSGLRNINRIGGPAIPDWSGFNRLRQIAAAG